MNKRMSAATVLADDIERTEREDPNSFYESKLVTIRWMQSNGTPDDMIEQLLQIKLRPADRSIQHKIVAA